LQFCIGKFALTDEPANSCGTLDYGDVAIGQNKFMESRGRLSIQRFKCFADFHLDQLGDINLIAGRNNAGKSTLLEAIALACSGGHPKRFFRFLQEREAPATEDDLLAAIKAISQCSIVFESSKRLHNFRIRLPFSEPPDQSQWKDLRSSEHWALLPTFGIDTGGKIVALDVALNTLRNSLTLGDAAHPDLTGTRLVEARDLETEPQRVREYWDKIAGLSGEDELVKALRLIEPTVERVVLPVSRDSNVPRVRRAGRDDLEPLSRFGDGMTRLFRLALAAVNARGGVLLIDEIENGLHYTLFPQLWDFLFQLSELNQVMIFATTHSWEAAEAFSKIAFDSKNRLGLLTRLDRDETGVMPVSYTREAALVAVTEHYEVR
jgi:ABC-type lipoprotein export system ATPase subunit